MKHHREFRRSGEIDRLHRAEIERAVNGLIDHFGDEALNTAVRRSRTCGESGDPFTAAHWERIANALRRRQNPQGGR
jgi:hypothetical protein